MGIIVSKFLDDGFRRRFVRCFVCGVSSLLCDALSRLSRLNCVALVGLLCLSLYSTLPELRLEAKGKYVLITGCDSGFGHDLAKALDAVGVTVFAGCLSEDGEGAERLRRTCSTRLKILQLDVTSDADIREAVECVSAVVGKDGLWGVVNNAGVCYLAEIEMTSDDIFRKVLNVNLMGMVRVTRSFLPLVRQSRGRIVNMSSVTGRFAFEAFGAYCASKFAIEGYSDVLRLEMKKWSVQVCLIEPSGFRTDAMKAESVRQRQAEVWSSLDPQTKSVYGDVYLERQTDSFIGRLPSCPSDLRPVVAVVCSALFSRNPKTRYAVGRGARAIVWLFPLLPTCLGDRLAVALSSTSADGISPRLLN